MLWVAQKPRFKKPIAYEEDKQAIATHVASAWILKYSKTIYLRDLRARQIYIYVAEKTSKGFIKKANDHISFVYIEK